MPRPLFLVEFLPSPNHGDLRTEPVLLSESRGKTWCGSSPLCRVKLVSTVMPGLPGRLRSSILRLLWRDMRPVNDRELRLVTVRCTPMLGSTWHVCRSYAVFLSDSSSKCTNICSSPSSCAYRSSCDGYPVFSVDGGNGLSGGWRYELMADGWRCPLYRRISFKE